MIVLDEYLKSVRQEAEVRKWMSEAEDKKRRAESDKMWDNRNSFIKRNTRSADVKDYRLWLEGFVAGGGKVTHVYDYDIPDDFIILEKSVEIPTLYGSASIQVIVPHGINPTIENGNLGHNTIYYIDGFKVEGSWIPVYKNI